MIELITQLKELAEAMAADRHLPAQASEVRDHARHFVSDLVPRLEQVVTGTRDFCGDYQQRKPGLDRLLARMQSGEVQDKSGIKAELESLYQRLSGIVAVADDATQGLAVYRTQVLEDDRKLEEIKAELNRRLAAHNRTVMQKRRELQDLLNKLRNPLYAFGETLARALTQQKSLQREIGDRQREIMTLQREAQNAGHGARAIRQISHSLDLVETLNQNLFNTLNIAAGKMNQIAGTIEKSETRQLAILLEAYLATLDDQVRSMSVDSDCVRDYAATA